MPLDLGRPVWVDDPHFNVEYHVRHTALPAPGGEDELRTAGRPGHVPAARSDQAAVGDLDGRGPRGRPLGDGLQDPPLHGRRRVRHRPAVGDHGHCRRPPSTPSPTTGSPNLHRRGSQLAVEAVLDMARSPYEQLRAVRAVDTRAPPGARAAGRDGRGACAAMAGLVRPTPSSTPQRTDRTAPSLRVGVDHGRRHQDGPQRRSAARSTTSCWPRSPAASATCCSSRGRVSRPGRAHPRTGVGPQSRLLAARPSATAPTRTRCRPCSPSCRSGSTTQLRAAPRRLGADGRAQGVEAGRRR